MQPKAGQIWTNNDTKKQAIVSRVIAYDRVLIRYSKHDAYDCCYELFLETYTIDIENSIKNLQRRVSDLLSDIEQLKNLGTAE
jgi:hypothetical protein